MSEIPGDVPTIGESAADLRTPKSTLSKAVREGAIPSRRIGRHWRFRKGAGDRRREETRAGSADGGGTS